MRSSEMFMTSIHGVPINTEEIESALQNHASIKEAKVAFDKGKHSERLVAWIVTKPKTEAEITDIRRHIEKTLSSNMVPSLFIFTKLLPLNTNGTVDRAALSFYAAERDSNESYEGPRNLLENVITDIWKTILGEEKIGIHDDFLDLGGDSIQAGLISLKIQECFNVELPLVMFFEDMTVAKLAEDIYCSQENQIFVSPDRVRPIDRNDDLPLSVAQEQLLSQEFYSDIYGIPYISSSAWFSIKLSGNLNREVLEKALNFVINRHEVFRTAYWPVIDSISPATNKWNTVCQTCRMNPGQFFPKVKFKQSIQESVVIYFDYYDISEYCDKDKSIEKNIIAEQLLQERYIYESPPLTRAALIQTEENEHTLIVAAAHIIADGMSMYIYENELASVYSALIKNHPVNLPELELQYLDYVAWDKHKIKNGLLDSVRSYWQQKLEGYIPTDSTILPFADIENSNYDGFDFETKYICQLFSREMSSKIRNYAKSMNKTVFSVLMAGYMLCLYRESGKNDLGVLTFFANRTRPEFKNVIGNFATGNIIRVKFQEDDTLQHCLEAAAESLDNAIINQELTMFPPDFRVCNSLCDKVAHTSFTCDLLMNYEYTPFFGLDLENEIIALTRSRYALRAFVLDSGEDLAYMFQYNLDLFDGADIRRIAEHTENNIKEIITNPESVILSADL